MYSLMEYTSENLRKTNKDIILAVNVRHEEVFAKIWHTLLQINKERNAKKYR